MHAMTRSQVNYHMHGYFTLQDDIFFKEETVSMSSREYKNDPYPQSALRDGGSSDVELSSFDFQLKKKMNKLRMEEENRISCQWRYKV